jgi:hypothetical protein
MASANLFQQYLQPVKSMADYSDEMDKRESNQLSLVALRNKNALDSLTNQQAVAKQNALQKLMSDPGMTDPMAREKAMLSNPLLMQDGMSAQKSRIENENAQAQARERGSVADKNSFELKMKHAAQAISDIASLSSPNDALQSLEAHRKAGDLDEQKYQSVLATLQPAMQDPAQFSKWKRTMVLNIMDAKDRMSATAPKPTEVRLGDRVVMVDTNPDSPTYKQQVASNQIGVSPDTAASNAVQMRGQNMVDSRARERLQFDRDQPKGQIVQSDQGTMLVDPRTGRASPVLAPDGTPLAPKLKDLPTQASSAIMSNAQGISKVTQAIDLLDGKTVGALSGDKSATGWKGYAPQSILNRFDPSGVDTRAMITDIGSLVLHDRSGAGVTASETPRLMPFIPLATDDAATARKKLVRFKQIYEQEQQAYLDTYSKDQGYKTPKVPGSQGPSANAPGAAPDIHAQADKILKGK